MANTSLACLLGIVLLLLPPPPPPLLLHLLPIRCMFVMRMQSMSLSLSLLLLLLSLLFCDMIRSFSLRIVDENAILMTLNFHKHARTNQINFNRILQSFVLLLHKIIARFFFFFFFKFICEIVRFQELNELARSIVRVTSTLVDKIAITIFILFRRAAVYAFFFSFSFICTALRVIILLSV